MPTFAQQQSRTQSSNIPDVARPDRTISRPAPMECILSTQQTLGNQAMQHLLHTGVIQAKLAVNKPGDQYEREAERVADAVMRMPDPDPTKGTVTSEQVAGNRVQ